MAKAKDIAGYVIYDEYDCELFEDALFDTEAEAKTAAEHLVRDGDVDEDHEFSICKLVPVLHGTVEKTVEWYKE
jgi:hypothetical protein